MRWFYNQCGHNVREVVELCKLEKPKSIMVSSDTEWFWKIEQEDVTTLNSLGVNNIHFLLGSFNHQFYSEYYNSKGLDLNNFVFWNTFWFNWGELLLRNSINYKQQTYSDFKYPFLCFNNKPHMFRCALVDGLAKDNMIEKGVVTWNKFSNDASYYPFKYFDNTRLVCDDDDFLNRQDSFVITKYQHEALFHIVPESNSIVPFITEKTVIPLLYKKPFAVVGCQYFNSYLKKLGFELYEELFDYSFDTIPNELDRAYAAANNVAELTKITNLNSAYDKVKNKILHNYHRVFEIINDKSYIPDIVKYTLEEEYYKHNQSTIEVFGRYDLFFKQTIDPYK